MHAESVRVVEVSESDRAVLEKRVRDRGGPARDVQRARIVLLSAQGLTGPQIADRVGCTEPTVVAVVIDASGDPACLAASGRSHERVTR